MMSYLSLDPKRLHKGHRPYVKNCQTVNLIWIKTLSGLSKHPLPRPSTTCHQNKLMKMMLLLISALIVAAQCQSTLLYSRAANLFPRKSLTTTQGVSLIDPITRFAQHEITLPSPGFPILQTNFTVPPDCGEDSYQGTGRLQGLNVLITGGDSGIGRATVIAFAREGANVAINYLPGEEPDAQDLEDLLAGEELALTRIPGDLDDEDFCAFVVEEAARRLGGLDILIGNAG
jgi:hypothetical protein